MSIFQSSSCLFRRHLEWSRTSNSHGHYKSALLELRPRKKVAVLLSHLDAVAVRFAPFHGRYFYSIMNLKRTRLYDCYVRFTSFITVSYEIQITSFILLSVSESRENYCSGHDSV